MSEMVERVARAIGGVMAGADGRPFLWERLPPSVCEFITQQARAAIKAMLEPTDEMLLEGGGAIHDLDYYEPRDGEIEKRCGEFSPEALVAYRAMIGEALSEG